MTAVANPKTTPVIILTTHKWSLLRCAWSLRMPPTGCAGSRVGSQRRASVSSDSAFGEEMRQRGFWDPLVTIPGLEGKSYSFGQCSSWEFALQETVNADFTWMYLEREELKAAMSGRRMPDFLKTSPKPNNFSEFSEAPEDCLHFNGKSSESSGNYSRFYFFIERRKQLLWIRDRSTG